MSLERSRECTFLLHLHGLRRVVLFVLGVLAFAVDHFSLQLVEEGVGVEVLQEVQAFIEVSFPVVEISWLIPV